MKVDLPRHPGQLALLQGYHNELVSSISYCRLKVVLCHGSSTELSSVLMNLAANLKMYYFSPLKSPCELICCV